MGMNITIEQVDIETAIETYVRKLIPGLGADTVVDIQLAATRGPGGFTAAIRLLSQEEAFKPAPVAEETKPAPVKVKTSGTKPLGLAAKAAEAKAEPTPEPAYEPQPEVVEASQSVSEEVQAEEAAEVASDEASAPVEAPAESEADPEPTAADIPDAPAEAPVRKSLFSNMTKPSN